MLPSDPREPPAGTRRLSLETAADAALDLVPRDDLCLALIQLVQASVKLGPPGRRQVDGLGLGTQALPELLDELQALLWGELVDVDGRRGHSSMIRFLATGSDACGDVTRTHTCPHAIHPHAILAPAEY